MALKGDLASVDLAQVFQMLALNRKVGLFCVTAPTGWRALYFEPRGVGVYCDEQIVVDRVLTQIARSGRVDEDAIAEIRSHAAERGMSLTDGVLASGALEEAELDYLIRTELEEQIFDLFFWQEADFEFFENRETLEGRPGAVDPRFRFSVDSVIMEAARRIDEWALIQERIDSSKEIFRPLVATYEVEGLEDTEVSLLDLVDGKRNVDRLIELTGHSSFLVFKGLSVLLDEGLIEPVPQEQLVGLARECSAESRNVDALNLYELALVGADSAEAVTTHQEAAEVCETVKEYERAGHHLRSVAEFSKDTGAAVQALQHVVDLLPTDLRAREQLVELTAGRSDLQKFGIDPVAQGKELVDLYLAADDVDRVRAILERLLEENPKDVDLKKQLVNVYSRCNDPRRVVELYESIADDLVQRREPIEAIKFLQKIVMIDRSRRDISERIRSLYQMDERSRSRKRSAMLVLASLILVCSLGVAWYFYDQTAREEFAATDREVAQLIEDGDYGAARARCEAFTAKFPLTLALRDVNARVATIDSLERQEQNRLAQAERDQQRDLEERRQRYRIGYELYKTLFEQQRLEEAKEQLESVLAMVDEAGRGEDFLWARENQIQEQIEDLDRTLRRADYLTKESSRLLAAGDWKGARDRRFELLSEYGDTSNGRNVLLPVHIATQPEGAAVLVPRGTEMVEVGRTPCTIECPPDDEIAMTISLDGFRSAEAQFTSRDIEIVEHVLQILPNTRLSFEEPVRGEIAGTPDGRVVAGLRGGRIGFGKLGRDESRVARLPGLDEFHGRAAIEGSIAYITTSEGRVQAYQIDSATKVWEVGPLVSPPQFDPVVSDSRVVICDESGRLMAFDVRVASKSPIWTRRIDGVLASPPVIVDQNVYCLTTDGELIAHRMNSGDRSMSIDLGYSVGSGLRVVRGAAVVTSTSGELVAIRLADSAELWRVASSDRSPFDHIGGDGESIFAGTSTGEVVRVALRSGEVDARQSLGARILSEPVLTEDQIVWHVRREGPRTRALEALIALRPDDLGPFWEFEDPRPFATRPAVVAGGVVLATDSGEVLRFR
ncbi:MAG: DUF4388 domain-containing protein [Planctomycetota bacterium]